MTLGIARLVNFVALDVNGLHFAQPEAQKAGELAAGLDQKDRNEVLELARQETGRLMAQLDLLDAKVEGRVLWLFRRGKSVRNARHGDINSLRLELWKITLIAWKEKAITGFGLGNFGAKMYKDSTGSIAIACTNDYLQILHDGGLILSALVFGYLANLFKRIIMAKDNILLVGYVSSFVAYLVVAGGSFIIWIAPMALIGLIYISAIETQV